jgi:ribonuclease Z
MTKLTFLGTSAQIPTSKRNHSAILINHDKENILVDCGEGTQRQFRKLKLNPCRITRILITHIHGDHIFGLLGLLSTLNFSEYNKTLFIYGPKGVKRFLEDFLNVSRIKINFDLKIKEVFPKERISKGKNELSGKFFENDIFYLESEKMEHGINTNAYNFVIKDKLRIDKNKMNKLKISPGPLLKELKKGKDIVHEGKKIKSKDLTYLEKGKKISVVLDTLYNNKIEKFVTGADILICESSFGSDLNDLAKERLHLTSEQAGKIAKKAKVKKLFLTHISQRYEQNRKFLVDDAKKNFPNVKIVNDFDCFEI